MTEEEVLRRLSMVVDPELGIDIVELGLVYGVEASGDGVRVELTLTTPSCPLHEAILGGAERALDVPGGPPVDIELVWDPPWSPDRIGAAGLAALGMTRGAA